MRAPFPAAGGGRELIIHQQYHFLTCAHAVGGGDSDWLGALQPGESIEVPVLCRKVDGRPADLKPSW